ncbi:hypothetical protein K0M31_020136 [Melipona bicolor]|uniref:Uncharacterized protein n=1 Tax=Melipona bicolor TaxID=60889 RepID=A0AA40G1J9_9HYME|nr:hypothetical protein K0M31_020136 [Melipona bicolor]
MRGDGSSRGIMDRGETVFCGILSIEFTENTGRRFPGHSCWSMVPATLPKSRPPSHNDIEIYRDADGGSRISRHFCARVSFPLASSDSSHTHDSRRKERDSALSFPIGNTPLYATGATFVLVKKHVLDFQLGRARGANPLGRAVSGVFVWYSASGSKEKLRQLRVPGRAATSGLLLLPAYSASVYTGQVSAA